MAPDRNPLEDPGAIVQVSLKAEGQGPPVAIRLRRWLKAALRGYGLRCSFAMSRWRHPHDRVLPVASLLVGTLPKLEKRVSGEPLA